MVWAFKSLAVGALLSTSLVFANPDTSNELPVSELLKTASAHLAAGRSQDALSFFDAAISRDPQNYLSIFKRGAAYLSLGRSSQAERDFNKVLELKPGFEGALVQRAKIRTRNGEWEAAKKDYISAGKTNIPDLAELEEAQTAAHLASEAERSGNWDECIIQAGIAIRVAPAVLKLRNMRSKCRLEKGDVESAITDMQHILVLGSGSTEPYLQVSALQFFSLAQPDKGLELIRKCLHSDPDNKACKKLMKVQKALDKRLRKMVEVWDKSSYATAAKYLVKNGEEQGLILDSKEEFEELLKEGIIHPKAPNGLTNHLYDRACEAYIQLNKYSRAKPYCEESLKVNPTSEFALLSKAKQFLEEERYEQAVATLKEALEHNDTQRLHQLMSEAQMLLRRSKNKDYYKILDVPRDADDGQIKKAYRKLTKMYHPDKSHVQGISKEDAEKKMAEINEAYETLSDPELRARVDRGDDPNDPANKGPYQQGGFPFGGGGQQFMFKTGPGGFPGGFGGGSFQFQFPNGFPGF